MKRFRLALLISAAHVLLFPQLAAAHGLVATWQRDGDQIKVLVSFDDGTKAVNAKITVKNSNGRIVAEGNTDAGGVWRFLDPGAGRFRIRIITADLHVTNLTYGREISPPVVESNPSFPWLKISIGIGMIGLISLALLITVRVRRRNPAPRGQ